VYGFSDILLKSMQYLDLRRRLFDIGQVSRSGVNAQLQELIHPHSRLDESFHQEGVMRLVAVTVVLTVGALLIAVAEVARSFSSASRAGEWAATGGLVLCGLGLMGMFVELYPPDVLRDTVRPRAKVRRNDQPSD
jgi:hypothetical protein